MQRNLWEEFKGAFRRSNNGLIQLILINGIVFLVVRLTEVVLTLGGLLPEGFNYKSSLVYEYLGLTTNIVQALIKPWTFITTFFTHYEFWPHFIFNMLFLYWFGILIKEYLGNTKLINLYILGGLAGGLLYMIIYNLSPYFSGVVDHAGLIGASASVLAIVVGAATLMPDHQFHLILLGPIKIKYIAIFYVVASILGSIGSNAGGNIAHVGGAIMGYVYVTQLRKGSDLGKWVQSTLGFLKSFFVRPNVRVTHRKSSGKKSKSSAGPKPKTGSSSEVPQEEIDAILDKISAKGYESLTKDEKQKLFNASK